MKPHSGIEINIPNKGFPRVKLKKLISVVF